MVGLLFFVFKNYVMRSYGNVRKMKMIGGDVVWRS
jgi:hypothetical protein